MLENGAKKGSGNCVPVRPPLCWWLEAVEIEAPKDPPMRSTHHRGAAEHVADPVGVRGDRRHAEEDRGGRAHLALSSKALRSGRGLHRGEVGRRGLHGARSAPSAATEATERSEPTPTTKSTRR